MPPVEPVPEPVVKQVAAKPPKPRPRPRARPVVAEKPPLKKPDETRPRISRPVASPAVALTATKPQVAAPALEVQQKQHYLAALAASINRSKYYPLSARRRGEQGVVVIRFVVQKSGELTDLAISKSSGSRRLDEAALKTVRRVTPFRPIPAALDRDDWSISVPIAFSLSG